MTQTSPQSTVREMFPQSVAVITQPSVATFERFERRGTVREAYIYVALAALVSAGIAGFFGIFHADVNPLAQFVSRFVVVMLGFAVFTGLVYAIGRGLFKGTGTYSEVAYTFALFFVPISIIGAVLVIIPLLLWIIQLVVALLFTYFGYLAVQSSMNIREQIGAAVTLALSGLGLWIVNGAVATWLLSVWVLANR